MASGKTYINTRNGAARQSSTALGFPYVEQSKLDRQTKRSGKTASDAEPSTATSTEPSTEKS